jgi:hypothetical protein
MNKTIESDRQLIIKLGGATILARKLGFASHQRVHNWMTRGIPPSVKLAFPKIFLKKLR